MRQKPSMSSRASAEQTVKRDIRRRTRKQYSADLEKIRIVRCRDLRGEDSIASNHSARSPAI